MVKLSAAGDVSLLGIDALLWRYCVQQIEANLATFPDTWKDAGHRVSLDAACVPRARIRLAAGIKPAKRGSSNLGDRLITEQLLELARQLRGGGFTKDILFISSNAKDYGVSTPKPPLDLQFSSLQIDFYQNVEAAMIQLGF